MSRYCLKNSVLVEFEVNRTRNTASKIKTAIKLIPDKTGRRHAHFVDGLGRLGKCIKNQWQVLQKQGQAVAYSRLITGKEFQESKQGEAQLELP